MFEILGNIYDSSIAIVFGTVFVGDCGHFLTKNFSKSYILGFFIHKTANWF